MQMPLGMLMSNIKPEINETDNHHVVSIPQTNVQVQNDSEKTDVTQECMFTQEDIDSTVIDPNLSSMIKTRIHRS